VCNLASIALPRFVKEKEPSGRDNKKLCGSLDAEGRCAVRWVGDRVCCADAGRPAGLSLAGCFLFLTHPAPRSPPLHPYLTCLPRCLAFLPFLPPLQVL
jgi:hypothetical protein